MPLIAAAALLSAFHLYQAVTGALPAIMHAITDALGSAGAPPVDRPATPERVWRALQMAA